MWARGAPEWGRLGMMGDSGGSSEDQNTDRKAHSSNCAPEMLERSSSLVRT